MRFYLIFTMIIISCLTSLRTVAQESSDDSTLVKSKIVNGDTIPHVNIHEVIVVPPIKFKNKRHYKRYSRLVINVKKTLPYARMASYRLNIIANTLDTLSGEKQRRQYLKKAEKELFIEFEAPLRKLTFSQGRMLIKLIDRETGDTSYDLIKDLKGGLSAFMWQSVARIFGSNLKSEYDMDGDDKMIEYIIYQIDNGIL